MAYIQEITGFITHVGEIEYVGKNETPKQTVIMNIPAYEHNGYAFKEEDWELTVLGKSVDKHNIQERSVGEKVKVKINVSSEGWYSTEKAKTFYNVKNLLWDLNWLTIQTPAVTPTPPADLNTAPGDEAPLPF